MERINKWKVALVILLLGLLGILSMLTIQIELPEETLAIIGDRYTPFQLQMLILINPTILLIMAVLTGSLVNDSTGLRAPLVENIFRKSPTWNELPAILKDSLIGGALAGCLIVGLSYLAEPYLPAEFLDKTNEMELGLLPRFLYGGITEEVMMRFGLMSLIVWVISALFKSGSKAVYLSAILIAAVVFALGHFPIVFTSVNDPSAFLLAYILAGNSIGGVVFGWLYWKKGLESAMIAHMFTHVVMLGLG